MRTHEKIVFKESRRLEVDGFPEFIVVDPGMFSGNTILSVDDHGLVSVRADNGWAKYKLDKTQDSEFGICLVRVASGET